MLLATAALWHSRIAVSCIICGDSRESETADVPSNVRAFREERFAVWRCATCRSIHARDDVDLAHYYAAYPMHEDAGGAAMRAFFGVQRRRLQQAGLERGASVLDYGCGAGAFVRYLADRRVTASGYDAYAPAFADRTALVKTYDAVVLQDVIEHVADPNALLGEIDALVRPGGLVLIGTPDADAIDLSRVTRYTHALHAPYHRHIFTRTELVKRAEARGWSLVRLYRSHYANTLRPFLNARFVHHYLRTRDNTMDAALDPPRPSLRLLFDPRTYVLGLFGALSPPREDICAVFRKAT
jgi:2-polyprenyl-3-methyl-5-hydroxy-6-metoxy-1,4-benzoquinol methylase